jgi:hypothetical protein
VAQETGDYKDLEKYIRWEKRRAFSSPEQELISAKGWVTYQLTGAPFATLRAENDDFFQSWKPSHDWEDSKFRLEHDEGPRMVSFNPDVIILPLSNNKNLNDQKKQMDELTVLVQRWLPQSNFVIGSLRDYIELDIMHMRKTGKRLLSPEQKIRTDTYTGSIEIVQFDYHATYGHTLEESPTRVAYEDVWIMPLLVKKQESEVGYMYSHE